MFVGSVFWGPVIPTKTRCPRKPWETHNRRQQRQPSLRYPNVPIPKSAEIEEGPGHSSRDQTGHPPNGWVGYLYFTHFKGHKNSPYQKVTNAESPGVVILFSLASHCTHMSEKWAYYCSDSSGGLISGMLMATTLGGSYFFSIIKKRVLKRG